MPRKTSPHKVKAVTYLTSIEHTQAEAIAKLKQLTLSEWIRTLVVSAFADPNTTIVRPVQQEYKNLPDVHELKKDFQFGDFFEHKLSDVDED